MRHDGIIDAILLLGRAMAELALTRRDMNPELRRAAQELATTLDHLARTDPVPREPLERACHELIAVARTEIDRAMEPVTITFVKSPP